MSNLMPVNFSNSNAKNTDGGDNNFEGCPAIMSDGRFITNYKPNCEMNRTIERTFQSKVPLTSWEYKYNLTNQADKIMGLINNKDNKMYGCSGYGYEVPLPLLKQDCNVDNCVINRTGNNNGIGLY